MGEAAEAVEAAEADIFASRGVIRWIGLDGVNDKCRDKISEKSSTGAGVYGYRNFIRWIGNKLLFIKV